MPDRRVPPYLRSGTRTVGAAMADNTQERDVFAGVDTHADTHHVAVIDALGRQLADREFRTTPQGYRKLLDWIRGFGAVQAAGVKGT
jgi:transposase